MIAGPGYLVETGSDSIDISCKGTLTLQIRAVGTQQSISSVVSVETIATSQEEMENKPTRVLGSGRDYLKRRTA